MAKTATLKAEERKRTGSGLLKQMRKEGWVPSVVYGGGQDNLNVKINAKAFRELLAASASDSFLVNLELDNGNKQLAFVQDIQHDSLSSTIVHADFLAVSATTEITAHLPIILTGEPIGVKNGGILEQQLHGIDVTCLPKDLPETLHAEVGEMAIGDILQVKDIEFPEGVSAAVAEDLLIALVAKTRIAKSAGADGEESEEGAEEAAAE
ncbi:50S ribosomal protein L25 [Roseibacillus persicicus]|uniref:Large ribosomal subunit protein bL25 n=1 Tax=Roseibacillus persicicus TaxID=454148 RepID=A0A918WPX6_9BACT|nr:50S ribosomal protein L25 [Roseibacillus persicicus]MDQ8188875.1 50S ribosomal protein L25 [Roseibacillus persicicus]GHC64996.1 50S ribosomal protein L25 [Roseibacillus persicicus]